MSESEELAYRQGRVDQASWIANHVTEYIQGHLWLLEQVPVAFRLFLMELMNNSVQEATHGTRSAVPAQISA